MREVCICTPWHAGAELAASERDRGREAFGGRIGVMLPGSARANRLRCCGFSRSLAKARPGGCVQAVDWRLSVGSSQRPAYVQWLDSDLCKASSQRRLPSS